MTMLETIQKEQATRESALRRERFEGDAANHERRLKTIGEQLSELKKVDQQLVKAVDAAGALPPALQSRYGDGVSRAMGISTTTADARLVVLAVLEGCRRDLDQKRGRLEADRDRRKLLLDQLREAMATEFADFKD